MVILLILVVLVTTGKTGGYENTGNYYFNSTVPCYNFKVRRMSSNGNLVKFILIHYIPTSV